MVMLVNANIKFVGVTNDIIEDAITKGLAKTQTEVLRLALFELKNKYNLASEDEPSAEERLILNKFLSSLKKEDYKTEEELWLALK